jgi:hypothetical protein
MMSRLGPWSLFVVLVVLVAAAVPACRTSSEPQPARSAADQEPLPDGGLPLPPPSAKKGIFVPADTGLGAGPSGINSSTGTNGTAVGPTIGTTPSN